MNKRLTNEQIEAIRKRAEAATEGPWRIGKQSPNGLNNIGTMGGLLTAQTLNEADAEFIAHAREDVPALLAEIDRLNGLLRELICAVYEYEPDGTALMDLAERIDSE